MVSKPMFPSKSIHQCFQWIYLLLFQTGILGLKIKNDTVLYYDRWSKIYCYMCRFTLVISLVGGFLTKLFDEESYKAATELLPPVVKVMLTFECVASPLIYLGVTFFFDIVREKYIKLASTLQALDEGIQKDFPFVQWNYYKTALKYKPMTLFVYGSYTFIAFAYVFSVARCTCGIPSSAVISVSYTCVTAGPGMTGFLYVGNIDMLRLRFRLIRKLVQQISMNIKENQNSENNIRKIKTLENYFKKYSCLITLVNEVFGFISASGLFHDFALITCMVYLLCSKAIDSNTRVREYVFALLFMTPRAYKVIMIAIYGFITQKEVKTILVKEKKNY